MQKAPRPPLLKWGVIRVSLRGQSLARLVRPRARVRGALHARLLARALRCLSLVQRAVLLLESSGVRPILQLKCTP